MRSRGKLRELYRKLLPRKAREGVWWIRSAMAHARAEPTPAALTMDYDDYWQWRRADESGRLTHPELVQICTEIIPQGAVLLDVGCGNGEFLAALKHHVQGIGVDISHEAVLAARARGVDARVVDVSVSASKLPSDVEWITLLEVAEHLPEPEAVLLGVRTLGVPVMVSIPNTGYAYHRLRLLLGRFPKQWIYHPGEHLRYWTLRDFLVMAERLGFRVERLIPLKGPAPLRNRWPGMFAQYLVFVLRPSEISGASGATARRPFRPRSRS